MSAALTTFASAHTIDFNVVARAAVGPLSEFKAKPATLSKTIQLCGGGRYKRDFYSRAARPPNAPADFISVDMGAYKGEKDPLGLRTYSLVT